MTRKYIFFFLLFCIFSSISYSQTILQGTVTDSLGEGIIGATVILFQDDIQVRGVATDFDGNYIINNIVPGTYDLQFAYIGLATQRITGVQVSENQTTRFNVTLEAKTKMIDELYIIEYRIPLVDFDQTSSVKTVTSESIANSPITNVAGLAATSSGLTKDANGNISIRGSRGNASNYYVDGIRVTKEGLVGKTKRLFRKKDRILVQTPVDESANYSEIVENSFLIASEDPLSTLSIDVDRASYSNVRRLLQLEIMPPSNAVRIEEMINYFNYDYDAPKITDDRPFSTESTLTACPWNSDHQLLHIALQGARVDRSEIPPSNFVFLIDVSGSMGSPNKLPLLQSSFKLFVDQLREEDRVAIVVYAGAAGMVLESTPGSDKDVIYKAIDRLQSGGSTAGAAGINLAYNVAKDHFIEDGNNRVILATDGDFNVGAYSDQSLVQLIEKKRDDGIFLSIMGFGMGNYQDGKMQKIADAGNGNHSYIDNMTEANKVFNEEFGGTMFTIAKDVKIQIEFNPGVVQSYRMVGYENRVLAAEDFNNDKIDAGEMGAGHTVTVMYEIIPVGVSSMFTSNIDPLKYQRKKKRKKIVFGDELATIKYRYKKPDQEKSIKSAEILVNSSSDWEEVDGNIKWAAHVASFGLLLRQSKYNIEMTYEQLLETMDTEQNKQDKYRQECLELVEIARELQEAQTLVKNY